MSKKGGGRGQAQLDARSRSMNPQDGVGRAALTNQGAQRTAGTPAHQAILDNRSVQLNPTPPSPSRVRRPEPSEPDDSLPVE